MLRPANLIGQSGIWCCGGLSDQFAAGTGDIGGVRTLDVLHIGVVAKRYSLGVVGSPPELPE